ncbi:MAG TPA: F0F1 ATP synthase subunit gamma [Actinomycetes bacterium]|nr:F0F1 ATP synthase subunit gamma [Actinomycetes bacterium]
MGAQLRVVRRRIKSVHATKKITRAMELIAASRIVKAQQRLNSTLPYTLELNRAITAAASNSSTISDHPLTSPGVTKERAAILVVTADRGLAGAYSSNAIREAQALSALLGDEGYEVVPYVVGRKGEAWFRFRGRAVARSWTGISDQPTYEAASEIADAILERFLQPTSEGGADEIHIVYTHFVNMVTQQVRVRRILPLEVVEEKTERIEAKQTFEPLYEFEPSAEAVLDALLPKYVRTIVYSALLESAAAEHAARRRAMKAATDNADELIKSLTRQANAARQAEITQEISEIVGGADALSSATAGSE